RILLAQTMNTIASTTPIAAMALPARPQGEPLIYAPAPTAVGIGPGMASVWSVDEPSNPNDDDPCEFKIVVLQALFQTDVQRGIVVATDWLKTGSTQTLRCKSAALTLLGRNGGKTV